MKTFTLSEKLHIWRKAKHLTLKDVSLQTGINTALLSQYENNKRIPTAEQLRVLAVCYDTSFDELHKLWVVEKMVGLAKGYTHSDRKELFRVAESRVEYLSGSKVLKHQKLSEDIEAKLKYIDELCSEWKERKPLEGLQLKKMRAYFTTTYTHESNRIEGNTLNLQETHLVVNEGLTISGKTMQEHLEAINHAEAVEMLYEMVMERMPIDRRSLLDLHALILKSIDKDNAGRYRSVPVRISGSEHVPPQPFLLDKLMEDYFNWYNQQGNQLHPVILAAEMHERLVSIHPFIDGNGRTARLLMNMILLRNGYPIAILKGDAKARMAYYKALEAVQVDNKPELFYEIVMEAVERSLKDHLSMTA